MLLAFGPLVVDTAVRTVVVGTVPPTGPVALGRADALWLDSPTAEQVAIAVRDVGLPVGVTVDDVDALRELVAAGAVAAECGSSAALDAACELGLTLWCDPVQADRALAGGLLGCQVVCEPGGPADVALVGVTVSGGGPAAWGQVVRAVIAGARVVRIEDLRSVRRTVTVVDRLIAARSDVVAEVVR